MRHGRLLAAFAVSSTLSLFLAACAGDPSTPSESGDASSAQPSASESQGSLAPEDIDTSWFTGAWLDDGYGRGVSQPIELPGTLCGIADGVAVSQSALDARQPTLIHGTDLATGDELWNADDIRCTPSSSTGEAVIGAQDSSVEEHPLLVSIDPRTGDTRELAESPDHHDALLIDVVDDVIYYIAGEDVVAVDTDGNELWSTPGPVAYECTFAGTYLGCTLEDDQVVTIDVETGEHLQEPFEPTDELMWLTDGYTLRYPRGPMVVFSPSGEPMGEHRHKGWLRCPPQGSEAIFPLNAFDATVLCVSAEGEPAVTAVNGVFTHVDTGHEFTLGLPILITADGSTVLAQDLSAPGHLVLPGSEEPIEIGDADSQFSAAQGWLVDDRVFVDDVTLIYPPAG